MKHTQGEWKRNTSSVKIDFVIGDDRDLIFSITHNEKTVSEREANDKLIAAIPELIQQLIKVVNAIEDGSINRDHIAASKELINKATL